MRPTLPLLVATDFPAIRRDRLDTLQVNLGYKCNQSCLHCHVNARPTRTEMMDADTVDLVLQVLRHAKDNNAGFDRRRARAQ
jgi:MoaA/NifB/PqqE/SkfB family radical SAM enzyme